MFLSHCHQDNTSSILHSSHVAGGKLVYLYTKKPGTNPKCGDCKCNLRGVSASITFRVFFISLFWGMLVVVCVHVFVISITQRNRHTLCSLYGYVACLCRTTCPSVFNLLHPDPIPPLVPSSNMQRVVQGTLLWTNAGGKADCIRRRY